MSGLLINRHHRAALRPISRRHVSLQDSASSGTIDRDALVSLLRSIKSISRGKQVHDHISRIGCDQDIFLANLLVQMYGNCGYLEDARRAFDNIEQKNVFSWNIMLCAYAQNGHLQDAKGVFGEMSNRSVVSWNAMLTANAQHGHLQEAKRLFDRIPERDAASWSAMIAAFTQNRQETEALQLYRRMKLEGIMPRRITLGNVLDACANAGNLGEGRCVHSDIVQTGCESDVAIGTGIINMYGKCKSLAEARRMFEKMQERDLVSWTAMNAAYAQNGHLPESKEMFDRAPCWDVISWTSMVGAYAESGNIQQARSLFDAMPQRDVASFTAMVAAYARIGYNKEALQLFRIMDLEGTEPNAATFITILESCSMLAAYTEGKIIHESISEQRLILQSEVLGNILVHMYAKCAKLDKAMSVFAGMPQRSIVSWTALITAYAQNGHGKKAVELFRLMELEGTQPDEIVFVSVLSACSHAGLLEDGLHYFDSIGEYGYVAALDHYICMIDLLGRGGQLAEAEELIDSMPYEADVVAWTILLGACKLHGDLKRGARAAENAFELDREDAGPYILLSSMYSTAGMKDEEARLRKSMRDIVEQDASVRQRKERRSFEGIIRAEGTAQGSHGSGWRPQRHTFI